MDGCVFAGTSLSLQITPFLSFPFLPDAKSVDSSRGNAGHSVNVEETVEVAEDKVWTRK